MTQKIKNVLQASGMLVAIALLFSAIANIQLVALAEAYKAQQNSDDLEMPNELLVKFKDGVKKSEINKINKDLKASVKQTHKKTGIKLIHIPSRITIEEAIQRYNESGLVEYAKPNYIREFNLVPNDTYFKSYQWNLNDASDDSDIDALETWDIRTNCSDVVVAVMDTGIDYTHPDLAGNYYPQGYDFVNNDNDPMDDNGHGTHVAGIIGAKGNNNLGISGVCWDVKLLALKVLNQYGYGTTNDIISAIEYSINLKQNLGVNLKVINMSFGGSSYNSAEFNALTELAHAGILVVAAAGNSAGNNDLHPTYPANYNLNNIISVGAMDTNNKLASYSNYGKQSVDIVAPGTQILSTFLGNTYVKFSGTSMAAPHVAGVVALLSSSDPLQSYDGIRSKILNNGDKLKVLDGKIASSAKLSAYHALQNGANSLESENLSDLQMVKFSSEKIKGGKLTLTVSLKNNGKASISNNFDLDIYLSTDNSLDQNDTKLTEKTLSKSIKSKKGIDVTLSMTMPKGIQGNYYLIGYVDSGDGIHESNENNNILTKALKVK